jgi:hypothetical protein
MGEIISSGAEGVAFVEGVRVDAFDRVGHGVPGPAVIHPDHPAFPVLHQFLDDRPGIEGGASGHAGAVLQGIVSAGMEEHLPVLAPDG